MASVEFARVDKVYDNGSKVVDDLNLSIRDEEFVVLVGPSGCGKSTTLRMVAGLESVTSGTISIDGRVVNDVPPKDRDIAMVFQSYALYPHMSVYENMAFGLTMRKVAKADIDTKVRRAAQVLGISALLDRRPKQLSGGQRQRVAVGRAIVREPKCFLFDEPLSNLDAKLRVEMRAELKRLHLELRTTTIYVTHDQEEAITLGDRVVVMHGGIVQQCADALTIYRKPVNRFVAGFLGSPPMNFLEGRVEARDDRLYFDEGSGAIEVPTWANSALRAKVGQRVVLGARPEALSNGMHARFPTDGIPLEMSVSLVVPLGDKIRRPPLYTVSSSRGRSARFGGQGPLGRLHQNLLRSQSNSLLRTR
ncbi:MAG: sn-glycerol-3-phosphate ABC transporter ATP-binding protein UgpC [Polyangiaceae bacterium]